MTLVLALDQGATKTASLVADSNGTILGAGYSPGAVHASDGMDAAMGAVREAAGKALAQAGAALSQIDLVCGGLSGADWPHEYPLLEGALRQALGIDQVTVVNDCIIARRAGTDAPWGAVLCAGTALNAAITSPEGDSYIYGYYVNGDDHGGTALGRLALRAVWGAESGLGPSTALTRAMLEHFAQPTVDKLLQQYVDGRLGPTSELVPVLVEVVRGGDAVAQKIVTDFGERLARYVVAGLKRFDMLALEQDVVLSGGIFKADLPGLRESVARSVTAAAPRATLVDARYEPVVGALLLALDRLGGTPLSLSAPAVAESAGRHHLYRIRP